MHMWEREKDRKKERKRDRRRDLTPGPHLTSIEGRPIDLFWEQPRKSERKEGTEGMKERNKEIKR